MLYHDIGQLTIVNRQRIWCVSFFLNDYIAYTQHCNINIVACKVKRIQNQRFSSNLLISSLETVEKWKPRKSWQANKQYETRINNWEVRYGKRSRKFRQFCHTTQLITNRCLFNPLKPFHVGNRASEGERSIRPAVGSKDGDEVCEDDWPRTRPAIAATNRTRAESPTRRRTTYDDENALGQRTVKTRAGQNGVRLDAWRTKVEDDFH